VLLAWGSLHANRQKAIGKTEESLENGYKESKARLQKIENAGYKVVAI